ncbi:Protein of unknown function [Pyronema omphalodes CBS 100304]|uniref:Uncharacterized protein n=1 Tax=Pyronema omphalodes (strain CBS 100304) TaxID=1076935 RepID=U4KUM8_PYROM|nr:Protein of unknown function [Pyronema omphalodes CBS 100304]
MDSPYLRFLDRPAIRSDYNHAEGRQLSNSKSSNSAPQLPTHKCSSAPTGQKSCKPNVDAVVRRIGALAGSALIHPCQRAKAIASSKADKVDSPGFPCPPDVSSSYATKKNIQVALGRRHCHGCQDIPSE